MNRTPWVIAAYAALLLQATLRPVWSVGGVAPEPLLILAVFLGQCGPSTPALFSALLFGVLADALSRPYPEAGVLIGPAAVGYVVAAFAVLQLRSLVFRHSVLSLVVMTVAGGFFAALVETAVLAVRGLTFLAADAPPGFTALGHLGRALLTVLYTAALAVPVGWMLLKTRPTWRFGHDSA